MVPSNRWFPLSLSDRAAWFQNFAAQFGTVAASLGLGAATTQVNADNEVMQFLADADVAVNAYDDAVRQFRKVITENAVGSPTPAFPAAPVLGLPDGITASTGIFERIDRLVGQIRLVANYTNETGALLGIYSPPPDNPNTPEQISVRARYIKGNAPIGSFSKVSQIVVAP